LQGDSVVTDGGRVLCVVGLGRDVGEARERAYGGVANITWEGAFLRTDIGHRALAREAAGGSGLQIESGA
jgi:phosphoribosylamine--glycine ligase